MYDWRTNCRYYDPTNDLHSEMKMVRKWWLESLCSDL